MASISGGNQPSDNSHQRRLANSEKWIADYKERVGRWAATPLKFSPNEVGVPTDVAKDEFLKYAQDVAGVTVTSDVKESIDLPNNTVLIRENIFPFGPDGYNKFCNLIASIVTNGSNILGQIKNITFVKQEFPHAFMTEKGTLSFGYNYSDTEGITYENPPENSTLPREYKSRLDSINPYGESWSPNSMRNIALTAEHEAVHALLMGACREFLEISKFKSVKHPCEMADHIMRFYTNQLFDKDPTIINNALKKTMLTGYFNSDPQEFFTTLFEAHASEIASRTPITQEMADAVGSTVAHLTQQKETYLPAVSAEQREQLAQLIKLIKETPFDLTGWWQIQSTLREEFHDQLKLPPIDYSDLPKVDKLLSADGLNRYFSEGSVVDNLAHLDRDHPKLYKFILELDKQHPEVMGANARDFDTAGKTVLHALFESEKTATQKPFSDLIDLMYPELQNQQKRVLDSQDLDVLALVQRLHSSYKFIEATGGRPANDDLFYSRHRAEGLPIPEHPNEVAYRAELQLRKLAAETAKLAAEAKFLAEHAHLLDLPKRFMTMLDNLDEKELMITMLHRLV